MAKTNDNNNKTKPYEIAKRERAHSAVRHRKVKIRHLAGLSGKCEKYKSIQKRDCCLLFGCR